MPSFINFWTLHTMTLQNAIHNQRPSALTLYTGNSHDLDAFAVVETLAPDALRFSELNEQVRRITHEQRFPTEFADEMSDAEAEAGMARIVFQIDGHEFSDARITRTL